MSCLINNSNRHNECTRLLTSANLGELGECAPCVWGGRTAENIEAGWAEGALGGCWVPSPAPRDEQTYMLPAKKAIFKDLESRKSHDLSWDAVPTFENVYF